MNTKELKKEIDNLGSEVRMSIQGMGPRKMERKMGFGYIQDYSAFALGKVKWSTDKIIRIAEKLGL